MPFTTPDALKLAVGERQYLTAFDDNNDEEGDAPAAEQVIWRGDERIRGILRVIFNGDPPWLNDADAPDSVKVLSLEYAILLTRGRLREFDNATLDRKLAAMDARMERLAGSYIKIVNNQPSTQSQVAEYEGDARPGSTAAGLVSPNRQGEFLDDDAAFFRPALREGCR